MRQEWEPEELVASWTPLDADWALVANKARAIRLGFALLLKVSELEARFPRDPADGSPFLADQVAVAATELAAYDRARPGQRAPDTTRASRQGRCRGFQAARSGGTSGSSVTRRTRRPSVVAPDFWRS